MDRELSNEIMSNPRINEIMSLTGFDAFMDSLPTETLMDEIRLEEALASWFYLKRAQFGDEIEELVFLVQNICGYKYIS